MGCMMAVADKPDDWLEHDGPPDLVDRIDPDLREKLIHEATADMVPGV